MRALVIAGLFALSSGCALFGKGEVLSIRYYTPEQIKPHITSAESGAPHAMGLEIGRISAGSHLRERIAYRDAAYEVGYYDDRRWTERPDVYVRRELARALFQEHGFHRTVGGGAPVVDVELMSFEELKLPDMHAGRVQLRVVVGQGNEALLEETITVDKPIVGDKPENVVAAIGEALDAAVLQIAERVERTAALRSAAPKK